MTLINIIRECPALHSYGGDDGSLLDILRNPFPEFIETALAEGLHPASGPPQQHQTLLQRAVCDNDLRLIALCLRMALMLNVGTVKERLRLATLLHGPRRKSSRRFCEQART